MSYVVLPRKQVEQVLRVLRSADLDNWDADSAITDLTAALAAPQPEPVGEVVTRHYENNRNSIGFQEAQLYRRVKLDGRTKLYTHPAPDSKVREAAEKWGKAHAGDDTEAYLDACTELRKALEETE